MTDDEDISILKRKIVAVDKLVRAKQKVETKNAELSASLEAKQKELEEARAAKEQDHQKQLAEKMREIAELKAQLARAESSGPDLLLPTPASAPGEREEVKKVVRELEEVKEQLREATKLQKHHEKAARNLDHLKMESAKRAARVKELETELEKKNKEIIEREKERQELGRKVEQVEDSKKKMVKDLENGKHQENIKASYEKVKWENLAEISSLKQRNAALSEEVKHLKATVETLKTANDDLSKSAEAEIADNQALEKKDRQIISLEKKLAKANDRLIHANKSKVKKVDSSIDSDMEVDIEVGIEQELDEDEIEVTAPPSKLRRFSFLAPKIISRFSVFSNSKPQKQKVVQFTKVGTLDDLTCRLPLPTLIPSLSISDLISRPRPQPTKSKTVKRSRQESSSPASSASSPRKKIKPSLSNESGLTASPNHRPPPPSSPSFPHIPVPTSIITKPTGDSSTKPPASQAPASKAKQKPNKTMKKAMRIMAANRQLPAPPKQSTTVKTDHEERLSDTDDNDEIETAQQGVSPASAPRAPASQRIAHVPPKPPSLQELKLKAVVKTPNDTKPPSDSVFKEPKRIGRPPGKHIDPSPPVQALPGSARERIQAAGLGPQVVEQNLASRTLGKLNPAQMEAAKRRANIASQPFLPSKDGFRMSAHEGKSKEKSKEVTKKRKAEVDPSGDDEEFFCPSRHSTAPSCVALSASSDQHQTTDNDKHGKEAENIKSEPLKKQEDTNPGSGAKSANTTISSSEPGDLGRGSDRTHSTESLDDDLNLSDSEGEEESENLASQSGEKTEENEVKSKPVVDTFEEDNYDALDFGLSSEDSENEEHMEVDKDPEKTKTKEVKDVDHSSDVSQNQETRANDVKQECSEVKHSEGEHVLLPEPVEQESKERMQPKKQKKKNQKTFPSLLAELDAGWRSKNTELVQSLRNERDNLSRERQGFAYEAHTDGLRKHFKNLMGNQNEESFGRLVDSIAATRSLPGCCNMVCDLAYQQLVGEHKDTPLLSETGQDQPEMTRRQQRLFTILVSLQGRPGFEGVMTRMLTLLRHALFSRDRMFHLRVNAVQNIGRMFVLCSRFLDDLEGIRHALFDLFFFKSPRNHLLLGIVMALWPDSLPVASDPLATSPLIETLVWCVFNTGPAQRAPEMKVAEVQDDFVRIYGYKQNMWKADDLVKRFIAVAESNPSEEILREVNNNIVMRMLKSFGEIYPRDPEQKHMRWVFTTLGLLARVYPAEGRVNLTNLFDQVTNIIKSLGTSVTAATEQCCLRALTHLGYHLQAQAAIFLRSYEPVHPLDSETSRMLEDFVGTRGRKHALITLQVARKEANYSKKSRGVKNFKKRW